MGFRLPMRCEAEHLAPSMAQAVRCKVKRAHRLRNALALSLHRLYLSSRLRLCSINHLQHAHAVMRLRNRAMPTAANLVTTALAISRM